MKFNIQRLMDKFNFEIINYPFKSEPKDTSIEIVKALPALYGIQQFINIKDNVLTFGINDLLAIQANLNLSDVISEISIKDTKDKPSLIIFTSDFDIDSKEYTKLIEHFESNDILVVRTQMNLKDFYVTWDPYIIRRTNFKERVHGVLMSIFGVGVLIQGSSGIGKSELAVDLIKNNHLFIADDVIDIYQIGDKLIGKSPKATRPFLEVRGVGIINIEKIYGIQRTLRESSIDLIINIEQMTDYDQTKRLNMDTKLKTFDFGFSLTQVDIPIAAGRSITAVVEAAVATFKEKEINNYNPLSDMEDRIRNKE